ncbi:hypothetical protein C9446_05380 [Providencia heimbachae]|uniref:hypothetical protein n=1 Tax=Providencia heimbachae TaxID=333962 RepID=UPI0010BF4D58|nr:hypothetical protein [Providencia heimbachae]QCJ69347.1 hypothetical protein C9446_05380 [Providencia heimbachae]
MKFKVGDRVKYINNLHNYTGVFNVGDTLEIINIVNIAGEKSTLYACIKDNPEVYECFDAYELGLINE